MSPRSVGAREKLTERPIDPENTGRQDCPKSREHGETNVQNYQLP